MTLKTILVAASGGIGQRWRGRDGLPPGAAGRRASRGLSRQGRSHPARHHGVRQLRHADCRRLDRPVRRRHGQACRGDQGGFRGDRGRHGLSMTTAPGAGLRRSWRVEVGYAPVLVARRARFFDLVVLGRSERVVDRPHTDTIEETLVTSGRPVLLAPAKPPAVIGDDGRARLERLGGGRPRRDRGAVRSWKRRRASSSSRSATKHEIEPNSLLDYLCDAWDFGKAPARARRSRASARASNCWPRRARQAPTFWSWAPMATGRGASCCLAVRRATWWDEPPPCPSRALRPAARRAPVITSGRSPPRDTRPAPPCCRLRRG